MGLLLGSSHETLIILCVFFIIVHSIHFPDFFLSAINPNVSDILDQFFLPFVNHLTSAFINANMVSLPHIIRMKSG